MNGDQLIATLDERLRDLETNNAAQTQAVEDLKDDLKNVEKVLGDIRDWTNQQKGKQKEAASHARWSGGIVGGAVSGIFIGVKAWFE